MVSAPSSLIFLPAMAYIIILFSFDVNMTFSYFSIYQLTSSDIRAIIGVQIIHKGGRVMANRDGKTVPFEALPRQGRQRNTDPATQANGANTLAGGAETHASHTVFDVEAMRASNTLGKKITEARKLKKISQRDLAALFKDYNISVSSGAISKWEKGDALPNPYQLLALCQILEIKDALRYFTGKTVEPEDYSPELSQRGLNLLQLFKETLIASGNYQVKSRREEHMAAPRKPILVKVFSTPAAAGSGSFMTSEDYDMIEFDPANVPEDTDFGIRVTGDSMLPRYVPGQIVFVEQCKELYSGEIGVFICDENAYIKQYVESIPSEDEWEDYMTSEGVIRPKIDLVSLNRDRSDCDVDVRPDNMLVIVGRVLN